MTENDNDAKRLSAKIKGILEASLIKKTSRSVPLSAAEKLRLCEEWNNTKFQAAVLKAVRLFFDIESGPFQRDPKKGPYHRRCDAYHLGFGLDLEVNDDGDFFIRPRFFPHRNPDRTEFVMRGVMDPSAVNSPEPLTTITRFPCYPYTGKDPWHIVAQMEFNLGLINDIEARTLDLMIEDYFLGNPPEGFSFSLKFVKGPISHEPPHPQLVITETDDTVQKRLEKAHIIKKRVVEALEGCPAIKRVKVESAGDNRDSDEDSEE